MKMREKKITGKKAVIFDVDNTILDSTPVFIQAYKDLRITLTKRLGKDIGDELMDKFMFDLYKDRGKYKGVLDMNFISEDFTQGLLKEKVIDDKVEIRNEIEKPLKEIYKKSPPFLPGAQQLLKYLYEEGLRIAFCTHSGKWGNLKVKSIWEDMGFPKEELVYLTIPLDKEKDSNSWLEIINMLGLKPTKVVVIGDNKGADIVEAQKVGVDTFIYYRYAIIHNVDFYDDDICIDNPGSIVYRKDHLKDIIELF